MKHEWNRSLLRHQIWGYCFELHPLGEIVGYKGDLDGELVLQDSPLEVYK